MENCNIRKNKQNQPVYAKENYEAEKKEKKQHTRHKQSENKIQSFSKNW